MSVLAECPYLAGHVIKKLLFEQNTEKLEEDISTVKVNILALTKTSFQGQNPRKHSNIAHCYITNYQSHCMLNSFNFGAKIVWKHDDLNKSSYPLSCSAGHIDLSNEGFLPSMFEKYNCCCLVGRGWHNFLLTVCPQDCSDRALTFQGSATDASTHRALFKTLYEAKHNVYVVVQFYPWFNFYFLLF